MGKIGLKSGKIVKIRWNRAKTRFHTRFYAFGTTQTIVRHCSLQLQVSSAYWPIGYTQSNTEQKPTINTLNSSIFIFLHRLSHNTAEEKIKIPKSTTTFFILILLLLTTGPPPTTLFLTSHREIQISDNNSGGSLVIQSPPAIVSYSIYLFSPSANSIMI